MPTAAKLIAALAFFAVAFVAAESFKPLMPPGSQFGYFSLICGGIGAVTGWMVSGAMAGRGTITAIGNGIRSSATIVFFALILFTGREMVIRSMQHMYHGPMDALQAMAGMIAKYAVMLTATTELVVLIGGGILAGLVTEWASRRWR
ncbi:TrgA family protein [Solirhodobacter olei]|uniref:TrgA family protein n=1 Tax=Solirhodobacter olei TaxID=2493082 RepID=UPI000FD7B69A|nr:TrgA family protein [Solirhodobacter olei]